MLPSGEYESDGGIVGLTPSRLPTLPGASSLVLSLTAECPAPTPAKGVEKNPSPFAGGLMEGGGETEYPVAAALTDGLAYGNGDNFRRGGGAPADAAGDATGDSVGGEEGMVTLEPLVL